MSYIEVWGWRDTRTGRRVSPYTFAASRDDAEARLARWAEDARAGRRPDIRDLIPHIEIFRVTAQQGEKQ